MSYTTVYDVIVCGGGTSGVAAAISAARTGAKTLLVERTGVLGGQMSLSGPPGFAYARLFNPQGKRDIGGIVEETYQRLYRSGHALPHLRYPIREKAGYGFSYVDPDWWVDLIFTMMEEEGVQLLLDSLVVGVTKEENKVTGIVVENANGRNEIAGRVVIDCTGEGYVAIQAGCEMNSVPRDEVQPHTLAFTVDGVDWERLLQYIRTHPQQFSFKQLIFPLEDANTREDVEEMYRNCYDIKELGEIMGFYELRDIAFKNGDWHPYSGAGFFLTPKEGGHIQAHFQHSSQVDHAVATDAWDLTRCNIECRKQNRIAWRFFKNYVPGFENAYITKTCTELRLREGPRIVGDYMLTRDDVAECRQFEDTIGKSSFKAGGYHVASMDTLNHVAVVGNEDRRDNIQFKSDLAIPKDGGSYDIPYRCLVPQKVENLLAAGKCVSTDRPAYLRYLHQTMVTGQAAGTAAGLCVQRGITPRELEKDVKELQKRLLDQGAILFECPDR
ncbi:MAG TPA: FAD-dependent oxidoreductase [Candidatus Blautia avistercoris]|nr:FAD-dependent oxidoreductase [Candidatus Blautia avistercoris]